MTREGAIALLEQVAGGLNDGHARWPVPELGSVIDFLKGAASHELEPEDGFYRCSCGEEVQIDSEGVEAAFAHGKEVQA